MNFVKKILVVHGAASARRRLMSLFADSGFDVRAFSAIEAALENVRFETFDLAVVGHGLSGEHEFSFIQKVKQIQPKVSVMLLASKVELMLLQDLQDGLAGVLVIDDDPKLLMRKVRAELKMEEPIDVTAEDLAQVESTLQVLAGQSDQAAAIGTLSAQLARERAELDAWHARLKSEEERSLTDDIRFRQEHQQLAQAQQRFAQDMEKLREEEGRLHEETQRYQVEHEKLAHAQQQFATEMERLHADTKRFQDEQEKLAQAQQTFATEMMKLRAQEQALSAQQEAVRGAQKQAEEEIKAAREAAEAAAAASANAAPALLSENSVFETEDALRLAWTKFKREINILEAERAMLVDQKLVLESHQHSTKQREEKVRDREIKITVREKRLADAAAAAANAPDRPVQPVAAARPPIPRQAGQPLHATSARPPAPRPAPSAPVAVESKLEMGSVFSALTRAPYHLAKSVLGGAKKA